MVPLVSSNTSKFENEIGSPTAPIFVEIGLMFIVKFPDPESPNRFMSKV